MSLLLVAMLTSKQITMAEGIHLVIQPDPGLTTFRTIRRHSGSRSSGSILTFPNQSLSSPVTTQDIHEHVSS